LQNPKSFAGNSIYNYLPVKHCNFLFFVFFGPSTALRKPFMDSWRKNFQQVEVALQAVRGTSTALKLLTRLSFFLNNSIGRRKTSSVCNHLQANVYTIRP
jgi:hypothetical protein